MQRKPEVPSATPNTHRLPATETAVPEPTTREHKEELLEEGLEESFPASDPPSIVRD